VTNFYIVSAGAAATLVGLLFVAVQIGPPLQVSGAIGRRHAMARSTFTIFAVLLALSMFLLLPYISSGARATVVLAAALVGAVRAIMTWVPVWADKLQGRVQFRLWQTAWLLLAPLVAYGFLALAAVEQTQTNDPTALDKGVASWFIALFIIGVRNSWNLLVEGSRTPSPTLPTRGREKPQG
jgi:hypothetical protein